MLKSFPLFQALCFSLGTMDNCAFKLKYLYEI